MTITPSQGIMLYSYKLLPTKTFSPKLAGSNIQLVEQRRRPQLVGKAKGHQWISKAKGFYSNGFVCNAARQKPRSTTSVSTVSKSEEEESSKIVRQGLRFILWTAEAVYIVWLFLLPYAPVRTKCLSVLYLYMINFRDKMDGMKLRWLAVSTSHCKVIPY